MTGRRTPHPIDLDRAVGVGRGAPPEPPGPFARLRALVVTVLAVLLALVGRVRRPSWLWSWHRFTRPSASGRSRGMQSPERAATSRTSEQNQGDRNAPGGGLRARLQESTGARWPSRWRLPVGTIRRRTALLLALYLAGMGVLTARLVQVQGIDAAAYAQRGDSQSVRVIDLPAQRGRIVDRNGAVLTTTVDAAAIYADPSAYDAFVRDDGVIDPEEGEMSRREVAIALSSVLDRPVDDLVAALSTPGQFTYLARQLDWDTGEEVMALDLPGIHRLVEPSREYPNGGMASSLIGITDIDGAGLEGLEALANDDLTGEPGQLRVERAASGGMDITSAERDLEPSTPGTDMVLTIDRDIQAVAERAAQDAMDDNDADGASVLVMDVETGEILAAASAPLTAPDDRNATSRDDRRARYFTDAFEPGSVQKAVTIAAAWEEGLIDEDTVIDVPPTLTAGGKTWREPFGAFGSLKVGDILERSSNVGTMLIAEELGEQRLDHWLRRFGYATPTGVGFPGESAGLLAAVEQWSGTSLNTIAIGHGVAVSLVQLAGFYQTLANDGVAVRPSILRGTIGGDGQLEPVPAADNHGVVSAATARAVRQRMQRVVDGEHGTGKAAAVDGYEVAGKTGTAEKPRADGRGYSNQTTAVFAGMAPVDDPELVVAVMVDEPATRYGGTAAAPTFSRVMGQALARRHVVPDTAQDDVDAAMDAAAAREADATAAEAARLARLEETRAARGRAAEAERATAAATDAAAAPATADDRDPGEDAADPADGDGDPETADGP